MPSFIPRAALWAGALGVLGAAAAAQTPQPMQSVTTCRVTGRAVSGAIPLPGVSIVVHVGGTVKASTSTDVDGTYAIRFTPNATYQLSATLTGFGSVDRDVALGAPPCDQTVDFPLTLQPRGARASGTAAVTPAATAAAAPLPSTQTAQGRSAAPNAARGGGRGFETLSVQADANGATAAEPPAQEAEDIARLLPAGFSAESAQADAIAITGGSDAASLDRGLMNDRFQAINQGQFDPATGQFAQGFGPGDGFGPGGFGGRGDQGGEGRGGRGGPGGRGGRDGGPGGRAGFVLGGRGARGQSRYQGSANYTFGGSALDSPPYQLRPDVAVTQPEFVHNNFGATLGGPVRIPGVYANTNRRTNFQLNYTGAASNNLFDQYATVPTDAMRRGDFSTVPVQLVDPRTGQPFPGNQIPANRIDPSASALLNFIPAANLTGATRNYHVSTTSHQASEAISLRLTQNLSPNVTAGGRGGRGGGFGRGGGGGGRAAGRGTNIVLTGQLQYRRTTNQSLNVFPNLGGDTTNTSITVPISLNVARGRSIQNFTTNLTRSTVETANAFSNVENVASLAGIQFPGAANADPLNWGVPNLTFSSLTGVRGAAASLRTDTRFTGGYSWIHPTDKHRLRLGGDLRLDRSQSEVNSNARGSFTFTGLYSSAGASLRGVSGADFADFLLGVPQQASLQVGGVTRLRQRSFDLFAEDNWQRSAKLTFNLGLRYELARPYVEATGRMANLDAAANFTAVAPVLPGDIGPFTGAFPSGLLNTDANNVSPRLGFAYRLKPQTILRGGYSITYNSGSYASIARQLTGQPPFADTETITGSTGAPLTLAEALLAPAPETTNNWGVDRDYALGTIQTWNATLTRNVTQNWMLQGGYTGIKGTNLDILRAPALGPGLALIPGTQPFIWESSGGHSIMNAMNVQVRRRLADGYSGGLSYTLARSMDNASSLGGGQPVVAQNDKDLDAEWAPSTLDRRHQLSANLYVELPWGPNRRWLKNGGRLAALFGEWSGQFTLTVQSGTPLTARVLGAASDLLRGVNGSLRANYTGGAIPLTNPTVDEFFNINAFSMPAAGTFGSSSRDMIVGPGQRQLNALFQRDLRVGGTRAITLQVNALNLLNTVQWAAVDTNINSPTFGQVLSARPMRTMTITARLRF